MIYNLLTPVSINTLADVLGLDCPDSDLQIKQISTLSHIGPGRLCFSVVPLDHVPEGSVLISPAMNQPVTGWLCSHSPRLDFLRALRWFSEQHLLPASGNGCIHSSVQMHLSAVVDTGTEVGSCCAIGPHTHIHSCTVVGSNVCVGASTVIGADGFGYERDIDGRPLHFPHLGRVIIGNNVAIGNLCTIARGVLEDTCIEDDVKIDDQSYIAHNVTIRANTLVMSGVRLNGRVEIGRDCWIGTGALVREGCKVGDGALVGMGSVVVRDVPEHSTVAGNPAREMSK